MRVRSIVTAMFNKNPEREIIQIFRYLVVSSVALAIDFGTLAVLTELAGLHYLVSAAFSYTIGLIFSYIASVVWVFKKRTIDKKHLEFSIFAVIGIAGLGMNELTIWIMVDILGLHYLLSRFVSAGIGYVWKYVARRLILFR